MSDIQYNARGVYYFLKTCFYRVVMKTYLYDGMSDIQYNVIGVYYFFKTWSYRVVLDMHLNDDMSDIQYNARGVNYFLKTWSYRVVLNMCGCIKYGLYFEKYLLILSFADGTNKEDCEGFVEGSSSCLTNAAWEEYVHNASDA